MKEVMPHAAESPGREPDENRPYVTGAASVPADVALSYRAGVPWAQTVQAVERLRLDITREEAA